MPGSLNILVHTAGGKEVFVPMTDEYTEPYCKRMIDEMFKAGFPEAGSPKVPCRAELLEDGKPVYSVANPLALEIAAAVNNARFRPEEPIPCRVCGEPNPASFGSCSLCGAQSPVGRRAADVPAHNSGEVRVLFLPYTKGVEAYIVAVEHRHALASGWSRVMQYTSDDIPAIMDAYNLLLLRIGDTAQAEPDPTAETFRAVATESFEWIRSREPGGAE